MPLYVLLPTFLLTPMVLSILAVYTPLSWMMEAAGVVCIAWLGAKTQWRTPWGLISLTLLAIFLFMVAPGHILDRPVLWVIVGLMAIGSSQPDSLRDTLKASALTAFVASLFAFGWLLTPLGQGQVARWHLDVMAVALMLSAPLSWTLFVEKHPYRALFFAAPAFLALTLGFHGQAALSFIALLAMSVGFFNPKYMVATGLAMTATLLGAVVGWIMGGWTLSTFQLPLQVVEGGAAQGLGWGLLAAIGMAIYYASKRNIWSKLSVLSLLFAGSLSIWFGLFSGPGYAIFGSLLGAFLSPPLRQPKLIASDPLIQEIWNLKRGHAKEETVSSF